jgi:hypothetical protein
VIYYDRKIDIEQYFSEEAIYSVIDEPDCHSQLSNSREISDSDEFDRIIRRALSQLTGWRITE